jgi:Skp family chaperone for outer membrane proteins
MKKCFLMLMFFVGALTVNAQKGVKIGYIDMDYILENVPDYKEAAGQLEQKTQKWKQDIEIKKTELTKLKDQLKAESALLTKQLIEEREDEIKFFETEMLDYQQKRFGPNGDLMIQQSSIIKPVQDQVFTAVQDIAEAKGYDFIFDKSSDLTMLFSKKNYDLSDQVIRVITRSEKREEMTNKQLKAQEAKEAKQNTVDENPAQQERQKILDDRKAARIKAIEDRKLEAAQKRKDFEETRKRLLEEQAAKNTDKPVDGTTKPTTDKNKELEKIKATQDSVRTAKENTRLLTIEKNKKNLEERRNALEEKRKKAIEDRKAAIKAKEDAKTKKN